MTFLHLSLLAGGLLALVPIALHMLGRRQPKAIPFPAIRFVRQTAVQAQKGWTVKRWLLLLMRVLLILLVALTLASPRVPSADFANYMLIGLFGLFALLATGVAATAFASRKGIGILAGSILASLLLWGLTLFWSVATSLGSTQKVLPTGTGPIATALVIDTSPSMNYQYRNRTRLDEAKEMAGWLMDRLPIGSQIAIVNSDATVRLHADRASANRQLEKTIVEGRASAISQRIASSIDALRQSELERREVYVLTDLSDVAWRDADSAGIAAKLAKGKGNGESGEENVLLQIIDVSAPLNEKKNWGLRKVGLSQQSTVPGASISLEVEVEGFPGSGAEQMSVELHTEAIDRNLVVRGDSVVQPELTLVDKQLVEVPDGGAAFVRLTWKEIAGGTNHAQVRLSRPDPLAIDNIAYLSVEAKVQGESLVVANDPRDAQLISLAVEPFEESSSGEGEDALPSRRKTHVENYGKLGIAPLQDYANIILYDPFDIDADTCDKLRGWVEGGGGLMIVLGSSYRTAEELMNAPVSRLLPGVVKRTTRRDRDDRGVVLSPAAQNHPIWSIFERPVTEIPWAAYPVFRHWDIEDLNPEAFPLMRFTQSELPAITEEIRGKGRILTWATPYPEPFSHPQGAEWSELYRTTSAEWPGFALFLGTVRYLASWSDQQLNYFVDQPAILNNDPSLPPKYQLFDPAGEQTSVEANGDTLLCNYTRFPGTYRLKGLRPQGPVVRGFSVNVQPEEISLNRVAENVLDLAIGPENFRIAKERTDVESSIGEGRHGRDLTPYIMVMVVMLFMAEQTMASRFYASSTSSANQPSRPIRRRGAA